MKQCPCGSNSEYVACCGKFIEGSAKPETAEQLLRSRYTAHVLVKTPYILATVHPEKKEDHEAESIEEWAKSTNWEKLEILESSKGTAEDDIGFIEFKVYYQNSEGKNITHHERSEFRKLNGNWLFYRGVYPGKTITRSAPKIGRNDPCPCGSGKKFKKCCGA